jgi:UDP-glucose 4-epimerase
MSAAMTKTDISFDGRRVFVTGADGFIGSHLAEALVRGGAKVTALALYNSFGTCGWLDEIADETRADMHIELGDVRDGVQMRALAEGSDIIFHLAALIGIPYSYVAAQSCVDVNIHGTLNMLETVRAGAAGRIIHTSTSEVYGSALHRSIGEDHPLHGQSPYAASKIGADQMVEAFARSHGTSALTLRPFNTFGPRQSERAVIPAAIRQMLDPACAEVRLGDLGTTRDFTFVGDTVRAFIALGTAEEAEFGSVYNAGTGVETEIGAVVALLNELTGNNKPIVSDTARLRPEHSEVRALVADATRLAALTGWCPRTDLAGGLSQCVDWWRERIAGGRQRRDSGFAR